MHSSRPTLSIDLDYYQRFLDDTNLTEEQKQELLQTLWQIVCEFVQMGFNINPVGQVQCGSREGETHLPTLEYQQTLPHKLDDKGAYP